MCRYLDKLRTCGNRTAGKVSLPPDISKIFAEPGFKNPGFTNPRYEKWCAKNRCRSSKNRLIQVYYSFRFIFFYKNPTNQPNPERFIAQFISLKLQNSRFLLHYQLSYEILIGILEFVLKPTLLPNLNVGLKLCMKRSIIG